MIGVEHFAEQTVSNTCVAACAGMILRARGEAHDEARLMLSATDGGLPFPIAAAAVGGRFYRWLSHADLAANVVRLGVDGLCYVVKVGGPLYVARCGTSPGGVPSRFGALATPGNLARPTHALLLVGADAETVSYFDPWYGVRGQPLRISRENLLGIYVGVAVEARV